MVDAALEAEVRSFVEAYIRTFDSMDGTRIAALYHVPTVTLRGDGSVHCLHSREALARFFQDVADAYAREGQRGGSYKNLQVVPIGGRSALATVDWEMRGADGGVIREWRQSYNLVRAGDGWEILVSTFHID